MQRIDIKDNPFISSLLLVGLVTFIGNLLTGSDMNARYWLWFLGGLLLFGEAVFKYGKITSENSVVVSIAGLIILLMIRDIPMCRLFKILLSSLTFISMLLVPWVYCVCNTPHSDP